MTDKLAKQLKEAGFGGRWKPTLTELIEACGDGFGGLYKDELDRWYARYKNEAIKIFIGKIPEEAVAKLWLKLNVK